MLHDKPIMLYSQGAQAWELLKVEVIDGRICVELDGWKLLKVEVIDGRICADLDGTDISLSKIQSKVLVGLLAECLYGVW